MPIICKKKNLMPRDTVLHLYYTLCSLLILCSTAYRSIIIPTISSQKNKGIDIKYTPIWNPTESPLNNLFCSFISVPLGRVAEQHSISSLDTAHYTKTKCKIYSTQIKITQK